MQPTGAETSTANIAAAARGESRGFPDPSLTLVEFSGEGLGILLAGVTERDAANRRIVLRKVAYVRIEPSAWGAAAYPEVWIQQDADGIFTAVESQSGKLFRHPSRRRYEVAFLSREIFDCAIQCVKERNVEPLYELVAVTLGQRPEFSIEAGCLLAPDDYAAETAYTTDDKWVAPPPRLEPK